MKPEVDIVCGFFSCFGLGPLVSDKSCKHMDSLDNTVVPTFQQIYEAGTFMLQLNTALKNMGRPIITTYI
jgi:hypothetical protein